MATLALTANTEAAASDVTYISSAKAFPTRAFLATSAADRRVRVEATAAGSIRVHDAYGHLIGIVPAKRGSVFSQNEDGAWQSFAVPADMVATVATPTTTTENKAATGVALAALKALGLIKAE